MARLDARAAPSHAVHLAGNGTDVHCATGEAVVAGRRLRAGDAVGVYQTAAFRIEPAADTDLVLVEVPMTRGVHP